MTPIPKILARIYEGPQGSTNPDELDPLSAELEVCSALHAWMNAHAQRDRARLADLYHPEAHAWDASSTGLKGVANLASGDDLCRGQACMQTQHVQVHGAMATNVGILRYASTERNTTISVPIRFSFTYVRSGHRWLIVTQHLSRMPGG